MRPEVRSEAFRRQVDQWLVCTVIRLRNASRSLSAAFDLQLFGVKAVEFRFNVQGALNPLPQVCFRSSYRAVAGRLS